MEPGVAGRKAPTLPQASELWLLADAALTSRGSFWSPPQVSRTEESGQGPRNAPPRLESHEEAWPS